MPRLPSADGCPWLLAGAAAPCNQVQGLLLLSSAPMHFNPPACRTRTDVSQARPPPGRWYGLNGREEERGCAAQTARQAGALQVDLRAAAARSARAIRFSAPITTTCDSSWGWGARPGEPGEPGRAQQAALVACLPHPPVALSRNPICSCNFTTSHDARLPPTPALRQGPGGRHHARLRRGVELERRQRSQHDGPRQPARQRAQALKVRLRLRPKLAGAPALCPPQPHGPQRRSKRFRRPAPPRRPPIVPAPPTAPAEARQPTRRSRLGSSLRSALF